MSEVRLNIIDANDAIHGNAHGSLADAVVAALSAEPETIAELEAALDRFIKRLDDHHPFASFSAGENFEPWDAGLVFVDLAARMVAAESSYSMPQAEGEVNYHDGMQATDVSLLYRIPGDWLFVYSALEYEALRDKRGGAGFSMCRDRLEPAEAQTEVCATPLDVRQVLYGAAMIEFIVNECQRVAQTSVRIEEAASQNPESAIGNPQSEDPIAEIHARWLMTPREDLRGQTPREVMLAKLDFIDFDLHTRELQWSFLGEGPPGLARDSYAYRFAGFGTHEYVLYYDLLRHLLSECWQRKDFAGFAHSAILCASEVAAESSRLNKVKEAWLNEPQRELEGRIPSAIIESERRRIPMVMSAKAMMIDENCDVCRMLAGETGEEMGPGFWHLDGCNMDEGFEFSFHRTREEWEEAERRRRDFDEEFNRKWAEQNGGG
jgi:PAS domain-containing protein